MKTGVVPIGSNAGGIKEVIKHGKTGFVVDVGDCDSAVTMLSDYLKIRCYTTNFRKTC